ncbi:hypothetical protein BDV32DRAFT_147288 [Aspergillus pseudonomiae]|nr:hypothetical protein BDV32DRAFT_147288 [Aspergillus pseudonomiae]
MKRANIHTAINPGLYIPDVGNTGLPISAEHAKAIIQSCHLSPYGKGTETLVDESVRKSWQLDASQFALQNPRWQHQVELFMDKAVTGLGLTADWREVKAELYKLLIYREGAFFLPHRDSEKADGMFGTLAVCLPSKHEGVDVIVSHRDDCLTFQTAPTADFGMSWVAWYADVTREVKPVTSGYRIVLIYNLIHRPSAALLEPHGASKENITRLLQSWACAAEIDSMQYLDGWNNDINSSCPQALIYVLEHQCTSAGLRFSRLKGVDQCRFAGLRDACQRAGFDLFLANIEKKDIGEVDDYEDYYDLKSCVTVESAFVEQERCSEEKFLYRLNRTPELCLGLFIKTDNTEQLIANVIGIRSLSTTITEGSMKMPSNWQSHSPYDPVIIDGEVIGNDPRGTNIAVHSVAVLPAYQGTGVGNYLVKEYVEYIRNAEIEADRIVLICHDYLIRFYESAGFVNRGLSRCQFAGGGWVDMVLEL